MTLKSLFLTSLLVKEEPGSMTLSNYSSSKIHYWDWNLSNFLPSSTSNPGLLMPPRNYVKIIVIFSPIFDPLSLLISSRVGANFFIWSWALRCRLRQLSNIIYIRCNVATKSDDKRTFILRLYVKASSKTSCQKRRCMDYSCRLVSNFGWLDFVQENDAVF